MELKHTGYLTSAELPTEDLHSFAVPPEFVKTSIFYRMMKRAMDIVGSGIGLICLVPVFLIVAMLIKLEDRGKGKAPVFFSQTRVGKAGKTFKMYKFRSMCVNAEAMLEELKQFNEIEGAMFKMKNDPRITKIGRFIRRVSIDELPQLWNVFKGEMSLVGPRPPITHEVEEYNREHLKRLTVKPGCSGLWQVGPRNDVDFEGMVELDVEYIKHQSIKQDLMIILKTIGVIVGPVINKMHSKSAY
jgi:lipopolysaccharide/colanic/teichoic acid biosynthesis glycosyltransferase